MQLTCDVVSWAHIGPTEAILKAVEHRDNGDTRWGRYATQKGAQKKLPMILGQYPQPPCISMLGVWEVPARRVRYTCGAWHGRSSMTLNFEAGGGPGGFFYALPGTRCELPFVNAMNSAHAVYLACVGWMEGWVWGERESQKPMLFETVISR